MSPKSHLEKPINFKKAYFKSKPKKIFCHKFQIVRIKNPAGFELFFAFLKKGEILLKEEGGKQPLNISCQNSFGEKVKKGH